MVQKMSSDSNDENNFPYKFLLTETQVWRLFNAFANDSTTKLKFLKLNCLR